ncbi:hypothetical protein [Agrococcus sp. Ld7]|uniref:hypothetical protein n=1 Tax=Agrococcus sp. Ld7 TaxID=649148 RepID=UPI00386520E7
MDDGGAQIAGYRLVRALRSDADREVWVGSDAPAGASTGAVELHRSLGAADGVLAREVEALLTADHPHLMPIVDVATHDGVVIVRPLLPRSLADWLLQRQSPPPGEAVTALAPIAAALAALHRIGASAGGCTAHAVRLDADGAPLLLGEGARIETERPTDAWRAGSEGVAIDVEGWRRLAEAVLEAGGAALPAAVERALQARDLAAAADGLLAEWPALPLAPEQAEPSVATTRTALMRRRERASGLAAVPAMLALVTERLVDRSGPLASRIARSLGAVRPRFWAIAAGGAAMLIVTAVLLWPDGRAGQAVGVREAHPSVLAPATSAAAAPSAATGDAVAPTPAVSDAAVSAASEAAAAAADPVEAVAMLLAEREACLDAGDAACLVSLHAPESPQLIATEPWRMPDDGRLELVQRLGDAWLLRVVSERAPASVLAMSTEAGWMLRDAWSD